MELDCKLCESILITKVDKLQEDMTDLKVIAATQTEILRTNTDSLIVHEKRTTASEERIKMLEDKELYKKAFVKGFLWVFSCSSVIAAIVSIYKLLS